MSFLGDRRNSPPVKDTGLGSPSLSILKKTLQREARQLEMMEQSILSPEQIYPPFGAVRKQLFQDHSYGASSMPFMVYTTYSTEI
jgi:hypothetical protein